MANPDLTEVSEAPTEGARFCRRQQRQLIGASPTETSERQVGDDGAPEDLPGAVQAAPSRWRRDRLIMVIAMHTPRMAGAECRRQGSIGAREKERQKKRRRRRQT